MSPQCGLRRHARLLALVDRREAGTGEPLAGAPRLGRPNANTAADQIAVRDAAPAQLPEGLRSQVLVRGDSGPGVRLLLWHITKLRLGYSAGSSARQPVRDALAALPKQAWRGALDPDRRHRGGAQVGNGAGALPTCSKTRRAQIDTRPQ